MPDALAAAMPQAAADAIADQRAKRDALPKCTQAWYEANTEFYRLNQDAIVQRRKATQTPLDDNRYHSVKENDR